MIIKKWNGSSFDEIFPKTTASLIYTNDGLTKIFDDSTKIKPAYLPNSVFDSLYYFSTIASNTTLLSIGDLAITNAGTLNRSAHGYYWVVTSTSTLTANPTVASQATNLKWYKTAFVPADGGSGGSAVNDVLETGDWIILTKISGGDGSNSTAFIDLQFAVVNNTYESATNSVPGIVKYGASGSVTIGGKIYAVQNDGSGGMGVSVPWTTESHTHGNLTYDGKIGAVADLPIKTTAGGLVATGAWGTTAGTFCQGNDSRLSDARTPLSHTHGAITNTGTIENDTVEPYTNMKMVITDASATVRRSAITLGTTTTTYLTNAGTWATPIGTTYSAHASGGLNLDGTQFKMNFPLYVKSGTAPVPTVTDSIWFDTTA